MRQDQYPPLMNIGPCTHNICAVIVSYEPDDAFISRILVIGRQVNRVVVIDNGSPDRTISKLHRVSDLVDVHFILNTDNVGVARALNQGLAWARNKDYAWALLLDQDTVLSEGTVDSLISAYASFDAKGKLAVIGGRYDLSTRNVCSAQAADLIDAQIGINCSWEERTVVITSGSLISLDAFEQIGPFREEFFIDHVDHEYCLRARSKGFRIIRTRQPIMKQPVGDPTGHKMLWMTMVTYNHSALRHYYMARNNVILAKEYLFKEPYWVMRSLCINALLVIGVLLFEVSKLAKIRNACLGLWHGCLGRLGKYERK